MEQVAKQQAQLVHPQDLKLVSGKGKMPNSTGLETQQVQKAQHWKKDDQDLSGCSPQQGQSQASQQ